MSIVMSEAPATMDQVIACLRKMQADYAEFPEPAILENGVLRLLDMLDSSYKPKIRAVWDAPIDHMH